MQQYADGAKRSLAQDLNTRSLHAPANASPTAGNDLGPANQDSAVHSRRFQKLNGLEVGTKTMVNPDQNVVVEAGEFLA